MNFNALLLEFLKTNRPLSLLGFGTFYLKNSTAFLDSNEQNILPPGREIAFHTDEINQTDDFLKFLSTKKDLSIAASEVEIKNHVTFWNSTLEKEGKLVVENIGDFTLAESELLFTGNRLGKSSPDFYGLEEINLSEIKNRKIVNKTYQFKPSIWWFVPLIVGVLAITYFGITQPENIFGKRSFKNLDPKKTPVQSKKPQIIKNSLNLKSDSLKMDSLQKVTPSTN